MKRWTVILSCALAAACVKTAQAPTEGTADPNGAAVQAIGDSPRPAGNEGLVQGDGAFVTQTLLVKREAKDAKELEEPGKKKRVANWVATLYRGEQVTALGNQGDWAHIRMSDGKEGYVKADSILSGSVDLATVFDKAKTFTRPDLLAFNTARQVEPGSLLFVMRAKDQFSEVNMGGSNTVWVLSDVLSKESKEVEAAKLINRARILKDRNEADANSAFDLAKTQFADTKLVQTMLLAAADPNAVDPNAAANPNGLPGEPAIVPPSPAPVGSP